MVGMGSTREKKMSNRYMAYDGEGTEVGYLTIEEARAKYDDVEFDPGTKTITVGERKSAVAAE